MNHYFSCIIISVSLAISGQAVAQSDTPVSEKKNDSHWSQSSWSIGLNSSPIIGFEYYKDFSGYTIQPGIYYNNGRYTFGVVPYFARMSNEYQASYFNREDRNKKTITFTGINFQARYYLAEGRLRPYVLAFAGAGYVWQEMDRKEEYGGSYKNGNVSLNLGIGAGVMYKINDRFQLDLKTEFGVMNNVERSNSWDGFLLPTVGIIFKL